MNKKGYSLVELLAVIVILALISLIVLPITVNLLSKSKQDTYNFQIDSIKTAMKNYVGKNTFSIPNSGSIFITLYQLAQEDLIDYKIKNPLTGKNISLDTLLEIKNTGNGLEYIVNINDEDISYTDSELDNLPSLELYLDYGIDSSNLESIIKEAKFNNEDLKSNVIITKINDTLYKYSLTQNNKTVNLIYNITYYIGKEVYFNPVTGSTCTEYTEELSKNGTKVGCMKWYIYNIDGTSVDMILDHNTTSLVNYDDISYNLKNDIYTWNPGVKNKARLITADEIASITNADTKLTWVSTKTYSDSPSISSEISYFYLDGEKGTDPLWHTQISKNDVISNYHWLYDNTYCKTNDIINGCKLIDDSQYHLNNSSIFIKGYWTSTSIDNSTTWVIENGLLNKQDNQFEGYGIRPVIRVSIDTVL